MTYIDCMLSYYYLTTHLNDKELKLLKLKTHQKAKQIQSRNSQYKP